MLYNKIKALIQQRIDYRRRLAIYRTFQDFTMIPPHVYVNNLALVEKVQNLPGCVVECGVWRGGMMTGVAAVLGTERAYYLFDSFEGLPPAKEVDGVAALAWQADKNSAIYFDNCRAETEFALRAMVKAGVKSPNLVKGWFDDTVPSYAFSQPIALLRLDGDWYDSTMVCLKHLFPLVAKGGLVILDDYYHWDGCSRALHDFLSTSNSIARIREFRGVCYLEKI